MPDPTLSTQFFAFLAAVFNHWIATYTGVLLVVEQAVEYLTGSYWGKIETKFPKEKRRRVIWVSAFLLFGIASFQAFNDVSLRLQEAQQSLSSLGYGKQRRIASFQRKDFSNFISTQKDMQNLPNKVFVVSSSDNESARYAHNIAKMLNSANVSASWNSGGDQEEDEQGVIFYVANPDHVSEFATKLMLAFDIAKIDCKQMRWPDDLRPVANPVPDFMIFVTRDERVP